MNFIRGLVKRKILTAVIIAAALGGGYLIYAKTKSGNSAPQYLSSPAAKGTLVVSVNGTGQVANSDQVDIKPQVSGLVTYVGVSDGQQVSPANTILQIDSTTAQKAVRDAQVNLDSAKLALQKLLQPPDNLSLVQDQNALATANASKQTALTNLSNDYNNGFNSVSNAFLDLPNIMSGLHDLLYGTDPALGGKNSQANIDYYTSVSSQYNSQAINLENDTNQKYQTAYAAYNQNFTDFNAASRSSPTSTIESLLSETYQTAKTLADAVTSATNLIQFYEDRLTERNLKIAATATTQMTQLGTYTGQLNTQLSALLNSANTIQSDKDAIDSANRTINQASTSLAQLQAGSNQVDIQSAQLTVQQRQNALADAQEQLAYYAVRPPFAGTIVNLTPKKSDLVSSGATIATILAQQQLAQISLNEVDVAKIKVGQKVNMTFDAIDGLTITGTVVEIDPLGTVSQGVVSYGVKIVFDTQDDRIKAGMSVSAAIITNVEADVLLVPNAAVKTQGQNSYVQILENGKPVNQTVQAGLSNDSETEILSGLSEGQQVITQTIGTSASSAGSGSNQRAGGILGGGAGGNALFRLGGGGAGAGR